VRVAIPMSSGRHACRWRRVLTVVVVAIAGERLRA
jgi:hypothetical protein